MTVLTDKQFRWEYITFICRWRFEKWDVFYLSTQMEVRICSTVERVTVGCSYMEYSIALQ